MDLTILNLKNTSLDGSKLLTFSVLYGRKEWAKLSEFLSLGRMHYSIHARATCLFLRLGLLAWPSSCSTRSGESRESSGKNSGVGSLDDLGRTSSPLLQDGVMAAPEPYYPPRQAWKLFNFTGSFWKLKGGNHGVGINKVKLQEAHCYSQGQSWNLSRSPDLSNSPNIHSTPQRLERSLRLPNHLSCMTSCDVSRNSVRQRVVIIFNL